MEARFIFTKNYSELNIPSNSWNSVKMKVEYAHWSAAYLKSPTLYHVSFIATPT